MYEDISSEKRMHGTQRRDRRIDALYRFSSILVTANIKAICSSIQGVRRGPRDDCEVHCRTLCMSSSSVVKPPRRSLMRYSAPQTPVCLSCALCPSTYSSCASCQLTSSTIVSRSVTHVRVEENRVRATTCEAAGCKELRWERCIDG